jgi:SNF2 family DNA or RNA helicase
MEPFAQTLKHSLGIPFGVAVIDESHNIKNPAALITRAIGHVNADIRIALSGTPVMNNTFDLYAQLSFVLPWHVRKPRIL